MTARRRLPDDGSIVEAVVADILDHGLLGWTLRGAGERIGVSARMLIHHFGSREAVLTRAFSHIHEEYTARWLGEHPVTGLDDLVGEGLLPVIRFGTSLSALAISEGGTYRDLYVSTMDDWRERIESLLRDRGIGGDARRRADLAVVAIRGIQADYGITGDEARARTALADLQALLIAPRESGRQP
ncbi:MAG: TetR/AcrR family transcriptional regulator [Actinomycetota bacterium]